MWTMVKIMRTVREMGRRKRRTEVMIWVRELELMFCNIMNIIIYYYMFAVNYVKLTNIVLYSVISIPICFPLFICKYNKRKVR